MNEFPNNSQRSGKGPDVPPEVDKQIEKIISGEAITRKPSGFRRLRRSFVGGDVTSVREHVFWNMLVPAAKDTISDMGSTFIDMMIFGEKRNHVTRGYVPQTGTGSTSKFNYSGITGGSRLVLGPNDNRPTDVVQGRFSPNEIIVPTRLEAEGIIIKLFEVLEKYNVVTVADLYRMVGVTSDYMDDKWGWTDLGDADVKRVRGGGMLLVLPEPKDLH